MAKLTMFEVRDLLVTSQHAIVRGPDDLDAAVIELADALIESQQALRQIADKTKGIFTNGEPFSGGHDAQILAIARAALLEEGDDATD